MLDLVYTNKFRKDLKRMDKRGKSRKKLADIIIKLQHQEQLDIKNQDHALTGNR